MTEDGLPPLTFLNAQAVPERSALLRVRHTVATTLQTLLDWLYPPRCAGCGRVDFVWCDRCTDSLNALPAYFPLHLAPPVTDSAAAGVYAGKLRRAITALKYDDARTVGNVLASRLIQCLAHTHWTFDLIIPVPLHADRLRERGYNQAQLIAQSLGARLQVGCIPHAIERVRPTPSQVGLSREARRVNVENAFHADGSLVSGRRVLLIDDVCTTGATIRSCAVALHEAGARSIYCLTVSAAARFTHPNPL